MSAALNDVRVSVNGGPEMPLPAFEAAVRSVIKSKRGGRNAAQTDLEDDALGGRDPGNEAKFAGIAADRLRSLVERWERLDEEVKALRADQKDLMSEVQSAGFVPAVFRQLIRLRAQDQNEAREQRDILDVYCRALGM